MRACTGAHVCVFPHARVLVLLFVETPCDFQTFTKTHHQSIAPRLKFDRFASKATFKAALIVESESRCGQKCRDAVARCRELG